MRQLERLEAQLDTALEAVRLALDSIPLTSLSDEERALYAILRTQADYKCYVPLTTDTLIRYATNYYNTPLTIIIGIGKATVLPCSSTPWGACIPS